MHLGTSRVDAEAIMSVLGEGNEESVAFESAVARLPYPVFVLDGKGRLRAMNASARKIWIDARLHEAVLTQFPSHPVSRILRDLRAGTQDDDESVVLLLGESRYEVIHSTRSPKGEGRWLMLMLRPFPTAVSIDRDALRRRWTLTPRESEVAAACIAGRTTAEICTDLSISRETLKSHLARLLVKSDCHNRSQLIAKFLFGG
jgi:DNA-binding CsgD family transcriptional regulator